MKTKLLVVATLAFSLSGCAFMGGGAAPAANVDPSSLRINDSSVPEPIYGNGGSYMCPYTEDGVVALWVDKSMNAKLGSSAGSLVGRYAGEKALQQVPFIGGWLGNKAGQKAGREIAIKMAGGWDSIKGSSDLSFNSLDDMALYVTYKHATHAQFNDVIKATNDIYPGFQEAYFRVYSR